MSDRQDGGPAFPCEEIKQAIPVWHNGMTLRDYFAGQALVGILANPNRIKVGGFVGGDSISMCYFLADVMLAERGKK